jgi:hypothetical protein
VRRSVSVDAQAFGTTPQTSHRNLCRSVLLDLDGIPVADAGHHAVNRVEFNGYSTESYSAICQ